MRIGKSNSAALSNSRMPAAPAGATSSPIPTGAVPPVVDPVTVAGVAQSELTPRVRAAIGTLMAEVQKLRDELTQSQKRIEYLEALADQDALAPVLNRRAFVRELTRMIAFAERYGISASLIYFDVDGMKLFNDRFGHAAGDAVLKHVAEILIRESRASDVVGRLGGDEYAVILSQGDAHAAAAKAAAVARTIAAEPVEWRGETLRLSLSYGAHTFAAGEPVEKALEAADRAMYARKRGGDRMAGR